MGSVARSSLATASRLIVAMVCAVCVLAAPARGDDIAARMVPILAPDATCMAQDDTHGLVVVGRHGSDEGHLFVHLLDDQGLLRPGDPAAVALPHPESLDEFENGPLSLLFHSTLPLLYVWQDIVKIKGQSPVERVVFDDFNHLLIYAVDGGSLRLEAAYGRGPEFGHSQSLGFMTTDPQGGRLFMPNLRNTTDNFGRHQPVRACVGYYDLDEKGMPKAERVRVEGKLDSRGLHEFEMRVRPTRTDIGQIRDYPVGLGFVAPNEDVVLVGGIMSGPAVWDTRNRRAQIAIFRIPHPDKDYAEDSEPGPQSPVQDVVGIESDNIIGPHPTLPIIYGATLGGSVLYRLEHAGGYPTMMSTVIGVSAARFHSAPLVTNTKVSRLVVGGENNLHVVALDDEGRFAGEVVRIEVANLRVRAVAHSRKFDRFYVPVEKMP